MLRELPDLVEPDRWVLAFHRTAARRWTGWLAFGRFKHVSAFTYVPALRLWVLYDVTLAGTRLMLLPAGQVATARLEAHVADAELLRMPVRERDAKKLRGAFLAPFCCVPAIRHLLALRSGALRPDALWRDCLRQGGKVVHGSSRADAADQPADASPPAAG